MTNISNMCENLEILASKIKNVAFLKKNRHMWILCTSGFAGSCGVSLKNSPQAITLDTVGFEVCCGECDSFKIPIYIPIFN